MIDINGTLYSLSDVAKVIAGRDAALLQNDAMRTALEKIRDHEGPGLDGSPPSILYDVAVSALAVGTEKPKCDCGAIGYTDCSPGCVSQKRKCAHKTVPTFDGLGVRLKCQLCGEWIVETE